jgi:hypothetical protein
MDQVISFGPIRKTQKAPPWQTVQRVRFGIGGRVLRVPVFLRLLSIKVNDGLIVDGTKEAGINIKVNDGPLVTGGTGTVTVKQDDT